MTRSTVLRRLLGAVVAASLVGGCGFAEKKELADAIRRAPERAHHERTARGRFTVTTRIVESRIPLPAGAGMGSTATVTELDVDFARRRGALTAPAAAGADAGPAQLVSGPIIYVRRPDPGDRRPWVKLDLSDLYDERQSLVASAFGNSALTPLFFVDVLDGALTGSVRRVGTETVGGTTTTHFRVNVAFDKALDGKDHAVREGMEAALSVMGVDDDGVAKGEVWLDDDGLPRRVRLTVRSHRDRQDVMELGYDLELAHFGAGAEIRLPRKRDIERVGTVRELAEAQVGQ